MAEAACQFRGDLHMLCVVTFSPCKQMLHYICLTIVGSRKHKFWINLQLNLVYSKIITVKVTHFWLYNQLSPLQRMQGFTEQKTSQ